MTHGRVFAVSWLNDEGDVWTFGTDKESVAHEVFSEMCFDQLARCALYRNGEKIADASVPVELQESLRAELH